MWVSADEAVHLLAGPGPLDAGAGHQHRLLRLLEQLDGAADLVAIGREPRRIGADARNLDLVVLHLRHEDVHRDLQVGRAGNPRHRVANRQLDVLGNPMGLIDGVGVLGDGPNHADVIHLLERAAAQVLERTLTAEDEDRRVGAPGIGDAGDAVGHARAGGDGRHADRPRLAARPGIRGVDGGLLVAHVDDLDALVEAAVVEGHDVAARKREDDLDAGLLESLRRELSAVQRHFADPRG